MHEKREKHDTHETHEKTQNIQSMKKKRKTYIRLDLETLSLMDAHIGRDPQKPSLSYANFIENYSIQIRQLTSSLIRDTGLNKEDISKKLKKTFKNRYFRLSRK